MYRHGKVSSLQLDSACELKFYRSVVCGNEARLQYDGLVPLRTRAHCALLLTGFASPSPTVRTNILTGPVLDKDNSNIISYQIGRRLTLTRTKLLAASDLL